MTTRAVCSWFIYLFETPIRLLLVSLEECHIVFSHNFVKAQVQVCNQSYTSITSTIVIVMHAKFFHLCLEIDIII
jgi:hypothetical protein